MSLYVQTRKNTRTAIAERAFLLLVGSLPNPVVTQKTSVATRFVESLMGYVPEELIIQKVVQDALHHRTILQL